MDVPNLSLDYGTVMSSWEKMGGAILADEVPSCGSPLDFSFLQDKRCADDSDQQFDALFTMCDLFDTDDLDLSGTGNQDGSAYTQPAIVPGAVTPACPRPLRPTNDMVVPSCEPPSMESPSAEEAAYPQSSVTCVTPPFPAGGHCSPGVMSMPMTIYAPVVVQMPIGHYHGQHPYPMPLDDGKSSGYYMASAGPIITPSPMQAYHHHAPSLMHHPAVPLHPHMYHHQQCAIQPVQPSPQPQLSIVPAAPVSSTTASSHGSSQQQTLSVPTSRPPSITSSTQRVACTAPQTPRSGAAAPSSKVATTAPAASMLEGRSRAECLERYRAKKARRHHTKMVRYQLRKINADNRPRIKGRFIKKGAVGDMPIAPAQ